MPPLDEHQSEDFLRHLNSDSPMEVVLRSHLWVESQLIGLLETAMLRPERLGADRLNFPQKARLAVGLGLIRDSDFESMIILNKLRNKVAHDLHFEPTDDDMRELIRSIPPHIHRKIFGPVVESSDIVEQFRGAATVVVLRLTVERDLLLAHRDEVSKLREATTSILEQLRADER